MKKSLLSFILAVCLGTFFAFLLYKNMNASIKTVENKTNELTFFQVGVFKNYENALNCQKDYDGIIEKEEDMFRVYISILKSDTAVKAMVEYFKKNNISYVLKNKNVDNQTFLKELNSYEELIIATQKSETYDAINKKILKDYEGAELESTY